ncbi:glycoside hydrolase family 1 protein [Penicillium viridicatum]|nr:glycoside hydrolase family 1 protein [Penicillium viridicatum]
MTVQDYVPLTDRDLSYLNGTLGKQLIMPPDFVAVDAYNAAVVYPVVDIATYAANNASSSTLYPNCVG